MDGNYFEVCFFLLEIILLQQCRKKYDAAIYICTVMIDFSELEDSQKPIVTILYEFMISRFLYG